MWCGGELDCSCLFCLRWVSPSFCHCLPVSFCLSMTLYLSFHLYPSRLCLTLCSALLSAPAPFISPCHWAMCAVPVSKTAGRLSSFPRWRMRGQRGSRDSYRLGSVTALPIGKLLPPVLLVDGHSDLVHFTLKMATYLLLRCSSWSTSLLVCRVHLPYVLT